MEKELLRMPCNVLFQRDENGAHAGRHLEAEVFF
jgi:hypothetical protein